MKGMNLSHSSKSEQITRVKVNRKQPRKTVGITIDSQILAEARNRNLNISRICEQALQSILDYYSSNKTAGNPQSDNKSSVFLNPCSFQKENGVVPRAGFEPATTRLNVENDLEDFRLFAMAKLNLSKLTVSQYICKVKAFLDGRTVVTDRDVQNYIQERKATCTGDYVSNVISAFKAYFRDYKGFSFMNGYKHPSTPMRLKAEIEPQKVKAFIEAIDNLTVKTAALFLATSGLRKNEVLSLAEKDIDRNLRAIVPGCHSGETKHSGISFYNSEAEACLREFEKKSAGLEKNGKLFRIGHETFLKAWNRARKNSGIYLKPKDMRDFFSQEMGKAFVPDRYIDIFQGRSPRNILAKHYNPHGIRMLREIYDKANLKVLI